MKKYILSAMLITLLSSPSFAEEGHNHDHDEHKHEKHDSDNRKGHDHDEHGHEEEDHDDHDDHKGHGDHEGHEHSEHGDDEHEEGVVEIDDEAAMKAGIKTSMAQSGKITNELSLNGKVIFDKNRYTEVKARFDGIVKSVKAKWGDSVSKGQTLALIEANESLRSYSVKSPISGKVIERHTNVGDVTGDKALFKIADLSKVWAEFHIFTSDSKKIKKGQIVHISMADSTHEIEAPIKMILPTADAQSQTLIAIVEIDNKSGNWRPNMMVEGIVETGSTKADITVHKEALQRTPEGFVIYVKEGDKYEQRHVEVGQENSKFIEILEGIEVGEEYVSKGSFIIKADIGKAEAEHDH